MQSQAGRALAQALTWSTSSYLWLTHSNHLLLSARRLSSYVSAEPRRHLWTHARVRTPSYKVCASSFFPPWLDLQPGEGFLLCRLHKTRRLAWACRIGIYKHTRSTAQAVFFWRPKHERALPFAVWVEIWLVVKFWLINSSCDLQISSTWPASQDAQCGDRAWTRCSPVSQSVRSSLHFFYYYFFLQYLKHTLHKT